MTDLPDVKLKALISFPANVLDGTGVDVVKTNGTYQFNLDFGDFAPPAASVTDSANQNALLWNVITGSYSLVPISVLLTGSTPSDVLPLMDGTAAAGISALYSRGDHKHPTDTSLATTAALTAAVAPLVETVKIQTFTASGTYTPSTGMLYCIIEAVGGGGGGGNVAGTVAYSLGSGGGGSGAYSKSVKTAAQIGASQTVTIAAAAAANTNGGTTSVGVLVTAGGGVAGSSTGGGAGGTAGTGDVAVPGNAGGFGTYTNPQQNVAVGGTGGPSFFGGSGVGTQATNAAVSVGSAGSTGSGGGGGAANNIASTGTGGAGGAGRVVITEFCSQ